MKLFRLNRRGSVLIVAYAVLSVLLVLGSVFLFRAVSDRKFFDMGRERTEAFYLAESAADAAINYLASSYGASSSGVLSLGRGEYKYVIDGVGLPATHKRILAYGYVPTESQARVTRAIEVVVKKQAPPSNFYDYALYSAGTVDINDNAASVGDGSDPNLGSVIAKTQILDKFDKVPDANESIDPNLTLATFDFAALQHEATDQGHVYTEDDMAAGKPFPQTFWFDEAGGIPNVVYVNGNLRVSGDVTIGGFFLIVGNIVADPAALPAEASITGNVHVNGCLYATGLFETKGGGSQDIVIDGGVWAGGDISLKGKPNVTRNETYMTGIENYINNNNLASISTVSWREDEG